MRLSCSVLTLAALLNKVKGEDTCSLYLAETVDDHGRFTMGVFTGRELPPGSLVGIPDIVVPLVDIPMHNSPTHEDNEELWSLWNDFVWESLDVGGVSEGVDVKSAALGLGSLTRGNSKLANAMLLQSHFDNTGLHRSRDPGAGATSYYHGTSMVATDTIHAGSEIFFPHGYHWYLEPEEESAKSVSGIPMDDPKVQEFFNRYQELQAMHEEDLTDEAQSQLWHLLEESHLDESIKSLLPQSWTEVSRLAKHVTNNHVHSPEWLSENGLCIDNLVEGPSTIPQAGRGAFSKRAIKEGSVIAPAPLVHVLDKKSLNMYDPHMTEDFQVSDKVVGTQLMLNYCFGHEDSDKLLCPIGAGTSFINHSPTPNAAIRWSSHPSSTLHRNEWLNLTLEQLGDKVDLGLMIEFVALRDIEPGEEIFIHYGSAWEKAWQEHVRRWKPLPGSKDYVSANDMNSNVEEHKVLRTVKEQETNPYPHSVITSCYYEYDSTEEGHVDMSGEFADPSNHNVIVKQWKSSGDDVPAFMFLRPCVVLERHDIEGEGEKVDHDYTVHILNYDHMHKDQRVDDTEFLVVEGLPRDAITFTDFIYSTDMHLKNAFRHEMMMNDTLFPRKWRQPSN